MNKYVFTVEVSLAAHSDEEAYESLLAQIRPLFGLCIETVGMRVNGKEVSNSRFDAIRDEVLNRED